MVNRYFWCAEIDELWHFVSLACVCVKLFIRHSACLILPWLLFASLWQANIALIFPLQKRQLSKWHGFDCVGWRHARNYTFMKAYRKPHSRTHVRIVYIDDVNCRRISHAYHIQTIEQHRCDSQLTECEKRIFMEPKFVCAHARNYCFRLSFDVDN